ncbi:hypothetical protein SAMN05660816_03873 [Niastella yeongjuensis]|nr:hypothetical protein SAMN05660816_03873 [Niastella yeongjuensis]
MKKAVQKAVAEGRKKYNAARHSFFAHSPKADTRFFMQHTILV